MVHREHGVGALEMMRCEQGIGGQRTDQRHALGTQALQAGDDHVDLFAAQVASFARVRVQPRDQDPRVADAEISAQVAVQDAQHLFQ